MQEKLSAVLNQCSSTEDKPGLVSSCVYFKARGLCQFILAENLILQLQSKQQNLFKVIKKTSAAFMLTYTGRALVFPGSPELGMRGVGCDSP